MRSVEARIRSKAERTVLPSAEHGDGGGAWRPVSSARSEILQSP